MLVTRKECEVVLVVKGESFDGCLAIFLVIRETEGYTVKPA
jgi:hypothetical protein